jgi:hypothetical protein
MPTHYIEDYDGERNDDAVDRPEFTPVVDDAPETKVVEAADKPAPKKAAVKAETK